jgi:hypothetical protein
MKINSLFVIAACSIVFISCGNNSNDDSAASTTTPATTTPATSTPANTTLPVTAQQNPASSGSTVVPPPTLSPGQLTQSASASGVKLNPAHGQPGHDCAIAVGAPLKSQSGITTPAQVVSQPAQVTAQPAQTSQVSQTTAVPPPGIVPISQPSAGQVKLNPAHGQPGHDCAIAVGAPLKSQSGATTVLANTQQAAKPTPIVTQTTQTPPPSAFPSVLPSTGKPKLNPAHGQPGHDCAIAVGQPLKN